MSRAIACIWSRSCSRTAVGVRDGAGLGPESGRESAVCDAGAFGVPSSICVEWSTTAATLLGLTSGWLPSSLCRS